ncbi:MAG TPA: serine/threonine-protein kinase, partial [Gemmatimonadales bacterium]|nr:serine/threonine-protein kinase [Gemmatimonadales bacterium]
MQTDALLPDLQRALAGRYVLERRLGQGGMGVVYLAREVSLERRVALKLLTHERAFQADARERFLREARTAARLSHPGIVPIFAVDEVREFVFFAMAYVEGQTLGQRVRGEGPLGYPAAARLLQEVARALHYAHGRGVVHRDVQPDNIMLERVTGRAVVSDFGIARVDGHRHTGPRDVRGTAQFMSPEQATGGPVDARSDLYALGIVGFFAVSGRLPFDGPDAMAVLARHVADPPPLVASVAPGIPERLAEAIDRCLAKDPAARYPSGEAFANALADAVERRTAVALRAFARESRRLSTTTLVSAACAGIAFPVVAFHLVEFDDPRVRAAVLAVAVSLVAIPVAVTLARVRRLVRSGFERRDLVEALGADLSHHREELAFLYGEGPSRLERVARHVCHVALAVAAGLVAAVVRAPALAGRAVVPLAWGAAAGVSLLAALVARARTEYRTDPKAERRLR